MSTDNPRTDSPRDCRPRHPEDGCDPSSIDDLRCRATGVAARAEYNAAYQEAMAKARTDYDTARKGYREARHQAALDVQEMKHQVKHLIERVRCLIEQDRVVRCLDEAWETVSEQLDCCEGPVGCCAEEREYDTDPPEKLSKLLSRIEKYQRYVDEARACFDQLVGEPAALAERVAAAKAAVEKINTALAEDPAKVDLKRVYAQALVARRMLARIWQGHGDTTDYVDCLCQALTSWSQGVEAVSVLTGARAEAECQQDAATSWCDALRAKPEDEVLAEYDRLCPTEKPCPPEEPRPGECDEDEHEHEHRHWYEHDHEHEHGEEHGHEHGHEHEQDDEEGSTAR